MWTPRRALMLFGGTLLFVGVYLAYSRFLGWLDGLPQLPAYALKEASGEFRPPKRQFTPTVVRLRQAFGEDCQEQLERLYEVQFGFQNGDSFIVLAGRQDVTGQTRPTQLVFSPFSLAVFGKPKTDTPNEPPEISTIHSDRAILEFDRPVTGQAGGLPNEPPPGQAGQSDATKPKLIRVELLSEPGGTWDDPRRGTVTITDNQRSTDPADALVLRSRGPVFYRNPEAPDRKPDAGPDIWTDADVEIIDRPNLPRAYGAPPPLTVQTAGEDLRSTAAVREVLSGLRSPPPTATATGMRIFLEPKAAPGSTKAASPTGKPASGGLSGARRIELIEKVVFHLWADSHQGFVSSPSQSDTDPSQSDTDSKGPGSALAVVDPPAATAAVVGGVFFPVQTIHRLDRALIQIQTLGTFSFDVRKNLARFDVLPEADPKLPNDVQVYRILPTGGNQRLFSEVLEIELQPSSGGPKKDPAAPTDRAAHPTQEGKGGGSGLKKLRAWANGPGRLITVATAEVDEKGREAEALQAYARTLEHTQAENRTELVGEPLTVIRWNRPVEDGKDAGSNRLFAGASGRPAKLIMAPGTPIPPQPGKPATPASTTMQVLGFGHLDLIDPDAAPPPKKPGDDPGQPAPKGNTTRATWLTKLVQTNEMIQSRKMDLLTFTDGAMFEDLNAGSWLRGNELKLWLESGSGSVAPGPTATSGPKAEKSPAPGTGQPVPHRLLAIGDVTCKSNEFEIVPERDSTGRVVRSTERLDVYFTTRQPTPVAQAPKQPVPTPGPAASPGPAGPTGPTAQASPDAPAGPGSPAAPAGPASPATPAPEPQVAAAPEEPARPKPPMILRARLVRSWVDRVPAAPTASADAKAQAKAPATGAKDSATKPTGARSGEASDAPQGGYRYTLDKLECEGNVVAHQDPTPPENPKDPVKARGEDVVGQTLYVQSTPLGNVMTVTGTEDHLAEVHHEESSIEGPVVVIDQVHNHVKVDGRGSLIMPAGSDLNGGAIKGDAPAPADGKRRAAAPAGANRGAQPAGPEGDVPPPPIKVHWADRMEFSGADKRADFYGRVEAIQSNGDASIRCHTMQVLFDRPIYFNQARPTDTKTGVSAVREAAESYMNAVRGKNRASPATFAERGPAQAPTIDAVRGIIDPKNSPKTGIARVSLSEAAGRGLAMTDLVPGSPLGPTGPDRGVLLLALTNTRAGWRVSEITFRTQVAAQKALDDARRVDGATENDNAKIEKVYCYPAPEDAKDEPPGSEVVTYREIVRDENGRMQKMQTLIARELVMTAQSRDARGEPCQEVIGHGPGTVRIWQEGQKDIAGPPPTAPNPPPQGGPNAAPKSSTNQAPPSAETEKKLTIVQFNGRMTIRDKARIYQESVFYTDQRGGVIEVINAPARAPETVIDWHHLPPGAIRMTCVDKLTVSTHTREDEPAVQRMDALGNVNIQTDEYNGWGEWVTSDGPLVTLYGNHPDRPGQDGLARIFSRIKGTGNNGRKIIYDRIKGSYNTEGSFELLFQQNPRGASPSPAPKSSTPSTAPAGKPAVQSQSR